MKSAQQLSSLDGIPTCGRYSEDRESYYENKRSVAATPPQIVLDDGGI